MERQSVVFLFVLAVFSLACGLIDDDDTNITYDEDIPFSFEVNADELCPQGEAFCSESTASSPVEHELEPIEVQYDIDVVERTGNEKLRDFAGAFRSIEITSIDYETQNNTLTFDLPTTTLYLGPKGAQTRDAEGVIKLATIPSIPAGENISDKALVSGESRSASSDLLQNLEMSTVVYSQPVVAQGQPLPPSGSATVKITINVEFTANPQDAVN